MEYLELLNHQKCVVGVIDGNKKFCRQLEIDGILVPRETKKTPWNLFQLDPSLLVPLEVRTAENSRRKDHSWVYVTCAPVTGIAYADEKNYILSDKIPVLHLKYREGKVFGNMDLYFYDVLPKHVL